MFCWLFRGTVTSCKYIWGNKLGWTCLFRHSADMDILLFLWFLLLANPRTTFSLLKALPGSPIKLSGLSLVAKISTMFISDSPSLYATVDGLEQGRWWGTILFFFENLFSVTPDWFHWKQGWLKWVVSTKTKRLSWKTLTWDHMSSGKQQSQK